MAIWRQNAPNRRKASNRMVKLAKVLKSSIAFLAILLANANQSLADLDSPYQQLDKLVVLRHATGTHLLDEKINSLNNDEVERAHGSTITEAHLTLGGITDELRSTAKTLQSLGFTADNTCFVASVNKRALETATVVYDYLAGQDAIYDAWQNTTNSPKEPGKRILTRLSTAAFSELATRVAARRNVIAVDDRLREMSFGPVFESGRYTDLRDASRRLVTQINKDSKVADRFEIHWREGSRLVVVGANGESEESEVVATANGDVGVTIVDLREESNAAKAAFLRASLEKAQTRMGQDPYLSLAHTLGAEPMSAVFARASTFLSSADGLPAHVMRCQRQLGAGKRFSIVFATHDSAGPQLISLLRDGRDTYPGKNYKMRVAEAVVIPINDALRERLTGMLPGQGKSK